MTKSYIKLGDIENALLALNTCPVSSTNEKYVLKRLVPFPQDSPLHLPLPVDVILDEVTSLSPQDIQREHRAADRALVNLAASNLKSTFQLAYKLLTDIVQITGWEALLKYRSRIFVMEDEYQNSTDEVNNTSNNTVSSIDNVNMSNTPTHDSTTNITNGKIPAPNNVASASASVLRSKKLCERWLDNVFMLLYEDMKTYTLWKTEKLYFEAQKTSYKKLTFEW